MLRTSYLNIKTDSAASILNRSALSCNIKSEDEIMKKSIGSIVLMLVFIALGLSGCAPPSSPVSPTSTPSPIPPTIKPIHPDPTHESIRSTQESIIYSTLINEDPSGYLAISKSSIILQKETEYYSEWDNNELGMDISKDILLDYQIINQQSNLIAPTLTINRSYELLDAEDLQSLIPICTDWQKFDQKYPEAGVYTVMSRVGFNIHMTQALIYMAHFCGCECATGDLYLLEYDGHLWRIKETGHLFNY